MAGKKLAWRLSDGSKSLHGGFVMEGKKAIMEAQWWQEKSLQKAKWLH
jgi:hypothetical protein